MNKLSTADDLIGWLLKTITDIGPRYIDALFCQVYNLHGLVLDQTSLAFSNKTSTLIV